MEASWKSLEDDVRKNCMTSNNNSIDMSSAWRHRLQEVDIIDWVPPLDQLHLTYIEAVQLKNFSNISLNGGLDCQELTSPEARPSSDLAVDTAFVKDHSAHQPRIEQGHEYEGRRRCGCSARYPSLTSSRGSRRCKPTGDILDGDSNIPLGWQYEHGSGLVGRAGFKFDTM